MPADLTAADAARLLAGLPAEPLIPHYPQDFGAILLCRADDTDTDVATVCGCPQAMEWARLFAAAPDLARAVIRLEAERDELRTATRRLRAMLAVPAAEYVPAMADALMLLQDLDPTDENKEAPNAR